MVAGEPHPVGEIREVEHRDRGIAGAPDGRDARGLHGPVLEVRVVDFVIEGVVQGRLLEKWQEPYPDAALMISTARDLARSRIWLISGERKHSGTCRGEIPHWRSRSWR